MKVETSALIGSALDWAVAQLEKPQLSQTSSNTTALRHGGAYAPSTDWSQGGPIIEREAYNLFKHNGGSEWCCACNVQRDGYTAIITADGPTPLIAAMRCYVASKLGDEVEVPDGLL